MAIVQVSAADFQEQVMEAQGRVLVDFWAEWCGPCRMLSPIVAQLAEEYGERLKVCQVNVDQEPELAEYYEIFSIPTLLLLENGQEIDRSVGVIPMPAIRRMIDAPRA